MSGRDRTTGVPLDVQHRGSGTGGGGPRGPGGWPGQEITIGGGVGGSGGFTLSPPWLTRPPQAVDFQLQATLAARTSVNTPADFPVSVQIPDGNVAVIRSLAILANNLLVTSDVRWTILYDDIPVVGWSRITISPRAAGSVEVSYSPDETFIHVPEGRLISTEVEVVDAGTYQVSVSLHGWFYPVALYMAAQASYNTG